MTVPLVFLLIGVAMSQNHTSEFLFFPSLTSIKLKYDAANYKMTSQSDTMIYHFEAEYDLPESLVPTDIDRIQIAIRKPCPFAYNFYKIKEYSVPIQSHVYTVKGKISDERFAKFKDYYYPEVEEKM